MSTVLERLQTWYASHCDGEWEHGHGVRIDTLDNPGWTLRIDLTGTQLATIPFAEHKDNYESERDWLICSKKDGVFEGACGPTRLTDLLEVFLSWAAESNSQRS